MTTHDLATGQFSGNTTEPREGALPTGGLYFAAVMIAVVGLAVSLFLSWSALTGDQVAGCGEGAVFSCSHVLHSKFAKVWGVPVSVPGAFTYAAILGALCLPWGDRPSWRPLRTVVLPMAAATAAGSAIWFTGLQLFALGKLCIFCLAVHGCSLTLAALILGRGARLGWLAPRLLPACAAVALLAIVQWTSTAPQTYTITDQDVAAPYDVLELDFAPSATADPNAVASIP